MALPASMLPAAACCVALTSSSFLAAKYVARCCLQHLVCLRAMATRRLHRAAYDLVGRAGRSGSWKEGASLTCCIILE